MGLRLILATTVALSCAGCQTLGGGATVASASLEDVYVFTNEPGVVGRQQFERGNYALAERYLREAVEKDPGDLASWIGLAASYDNLKRFDLADRAYAQIIQLGGRTAQVANNQGYSFLLRGDFVQARAAFQHALALEPANPVARNNLKLLAGVRARFG
jgi:Flp pilus assembly protein TadD